MDNELDVEIERLTAFNYIDDVLPRFADSSISSRSDYSEE